MMDDHDQLAVAHIRRDGGQGSAGADRLEQLKRASLRRQAQRMAREFGALVRRVRCEQPDMHPRMRGALEALQLLSGRLSVDEFAAPMAPAAPAAPASAPQPAPGAQPPALRSELF